MIYSEVTHHLNHDFKKWINANVCPKGVGFQCDFLSLRPIYERCVKVFRLYKTILTQYA